MSEFMLLLHENPADFSNVSAEEMQGVIQEYTNWRLMLERTDRLVGNHKLADEGGRILTSHEGKVRVIDGPFVEAKEVVGGYFIVTAADYDEAVEISSGCPHLKFGGRIELRQIDPIHD